MNDSKRRAPARLMAGSRWAAYAAAGAASALAAQNTADAAITHVVVGSVLDASGGPGTLIETMTLPADGASIIFAHTASTSIGAARFAATGAVSGGFAGFVNSGYGYVSNLSYGQNVSAQAFIGGTGTLAFGSGYISSQFLDPGLGYVGFRFDSGAGTQYGWARVDMMGSAINGITIIDYAYGDVGESITVGQTVPEPGSMALLAMGAAGLANWRRKRSEAAA